VLNQDVVFQYGDLRTVVALTHHHDAINGLPTSQELGLSQDRRTTTARLTTFTTTLLLRL
jgi:hypothetical protein